jgi:hypothetical protein
MISLLNEKHNTFAVLHINKKCQNALDSGLGTRVTPLLRILIEIVVYILIKLRILRKNSAIGSQSVLKNKNHLMQTFSLILFLN